MIEETNIPLEQRLLKARQFKGEGYNCAQCMFMAFSDVHKMEESKALALSCGLGGGVGGLRQICGAISTMGALLGMTKYNSPADKAVIYKAIRECSAKFMDKNGSLICGELKTGELRKPCMTYIEDAIEILHNKLNENH